VGVEEGADDPRDVGMVAALFRGFEESNDLGLDEGEVKAVDVAPHLGGDNNNRSSCRGAVGECQR
jgi:hypothetical protein